MDDLIHCTSHTLQLLIEYDPVRQRLDGLRLGSPRTHHGGLAPYRMRLSSPSDAVLERTDSVEEGSLKRRSLRYVPAVKKPNYLRAVAPLETVLFIYSATCSLFQA